MVPLQFEKENGEMDYKTYIKYRLECADAMGYEIIKECPLMVHIPLVNRYKFDSPTKPNPKLTTHKLKKTLAMLAFFERKNKECDKKNNKGRFYVF